MSKETWYGTEHSVRPIADTLKAAVEKIASGQDWNAELMLPKPNAFVPTNFDVEAKEIAPVPLKKPYLLQDDEVVKLWYKMDDQFLVPKMQASFLLRCPVSYASPRFATLSKLYTLMVKDALNEYSYDADIAGLEYRLDATWEGLLLNLQGYNHKLGVLLDTIVRKMSGFQADPERFELIKEKLIRNYRNFDLEQPYQHALYYTTYLTQEKLWTNQEKLHELLDVTVDELNAFVPMMLNQLHMEGLVHGNISAQGAVDLAKPSPSRSRNALERATSCSQKTAVTSTNTLCPTPPTSTHRWNTSCKSPTLPTSASVP
jgi:insulysin